MDIKYRIMIGRFNSSLNTMDYALVEEDTLTKLLERMQEMAADCYHPITIITTVHKETVEDK